MLLGSVFGVQHNTFLAEKYTKDYEKSTLGTTIADTFPDPELETCVGTTLSKNVTDSITQVELDSIDTFSCNNVEDITGIDLLSNVTKLNLNGDSDHGIDNISLLSTMTNLTDLNLSTNKINDISALESLTNLTN